MRSPGRPSLPAVTTGQIVAAAVQLIDEEGYLAFSVRGLADRLGVTPSTITHRVGSRTDVLVAAVDAMLRETPLLDLGMSDDWRDAVRLLAAGFREVVRRHRRATPLIIDVGARSPAGLELSIRAVNALRQGGIPVDKLLDVHAAVLAYVTGFCIQESVEGLAGVVHPGLLQQLERLPDSDVKERFMDLLPDLVDAAATPKGRDAGVGAAFEEGLDALLVGLAQTVVPVARAGRRTGR
jgi:AcrR family transcriptional regulator